MKKDSNKRIVYSLNVSDIQEVANEVLERNLTKKEVILVENSIGDYLDWFQAVWNSINRHDITPKSPKAKKTHQHFKNARKPAKKAS